MASAISEQLYMYLRRCMDKDGSPYSITLNTINIGVLGAEAWVVASNAPEEIRDFAEILQDIGYPVWLCDGTADQVQIQAALNALDTAGVGGLVQLSGGKFNISAPISLNFANDPTGGKTLQGVGPEATELRLINNANCNVIEHIGTSAVYFVTLRDFEINGNGGNQTSGNGIYIVPTGAGGFNDSRFQNVFVISCKQDGIHVEKNWTASYVNCISESNGGDGLHVRYGAGLIEGGFYAYNNKGIYLVNAGGWLVQGADIYDNNGYGIECLNVSRTTIEGCHIRNGDDYGIYLSGQSASQTYTVKIKGNDITSNVKTGIWLNGLYVYGCVINGNTITANGTGVTKYDGIVVLSSNYNVITGNICTANGLNGINLSRSSYCTINNNVCVSQVTGDGIYIFGDGTKNSDYNTIMGNACTGNGDDGIEIAGGANANKNIVVGNQLTGNSGTPYVDGGTATEAGHNITA